MAFIPGRTSASFNCWRMAEVAHEDTECISSRMTLSFAPTDIITCMYYTGIDPFTKQAVYIARGLRDRRMQRALMQFFKPENYFEVRKALEEAGRTDLIGGDCDALIPAHPPKESLRARREQANQAMRGDHYHTIANPAKGEKPGERGLPNRGYRPGRKTGHRQDKKRRRNHE